MQRMYLLYDTVTPMAGLHLFGFDRGWDGCA